MVEREIIKNVKRFAEAVKNQGIKVNKVILYGSRTNGLAKKYSDIDVAVISPDFGKDRFSEGVKLWTIARKVDPRIEPVPISLKSYQKDTWIPLIYAIRQDGIDVAI
jgi:uncharacterized protein